MMVMMVSRGSNDGVGRNFAENVVQFGKGK